jgi:lactate dehydrogenase-like 2-hydroxyacid dehydrogenase
MAPVPLSSDQHPHNNVTWTKDARKPKVFSLEPLHSRALALAREKFDLVLPDEPGFAPWPYQAEGLMARNAIVSPAHTKVLKENKIVYISKQGVGVDNFDLDELRNCGIPLMNTPGVNVSLASPRFPEGEMWESRRSARRD